MAMTLLFAGKLFAALLLGALVGLERQWRQRMAGTRTNALVAAGASAFVMAGSLLEHDPTAAGRVASYVVSEVGFLGAGVIFKDGANDPHSGNQSLHSALSAHRHLFTRNPWG